MNSFLRHARYAPALLAVALLWLLPVSLHAATNAVAFNLGAFGADAAAYRQVRIKPSTTSFPRVENGMVVGVDFGFRSTDASGTFTQMLVSGTYDIVFTNRFIATTFQITVPTTNCACVLNASDLTSVGTNLPSNLTAYSQAAADVLFAKRTNSAIRYQTGGVTMAAAGVTNVNFTIGITGNFAGGSLNLGASSAGNANALTNNQSTAVTFLSSFSAQSVSANTVTAGIISQDIGTDTFTLGTGSAGDLDAVVLKVGGTNVLTALAGKVNVLDGVANRLTASNATILTNLFMGPFTNCVFVVSNSSATGPGVLHLCKSTNGIIGASIMSWNLTNAVEQLSANQILSSDGKNLLKYNAALDTHFALGAGNATVTGARNLGIGLTALNGVSSGTDNIAVGADGVGFSITTGVGNTLMGSFVGENLKTGARNVGIGYGTLNSIISVSASTAVGGFAGNALTNGDYNTLVGHGAGKPLINGRYNTIVGGDALRDGTYVNESAAFGVDALMKSTNSYNAAFGTYSLQFMYDGTYNVALGYNAGVGMLYSSTNVFIGSQTVMTNGVGNIIIGVEANAVPVNSTNFLNIGNAIFATNISSGSAVASSSKVGIGTTTPAEKLDVIGNVRISGTNFATNGFQAYKASSIPTNTANFSYEATNDIVPGVINLGPAQRFDFSLDVYGTATLAAGFSGQLLYSNAMTGVIQVVGRLTTPAGLLASDVVTNQLCLMSANPNSMFWITNTAGGQSVSVVPGSCRVVGK